MIFDPGLQNGDKLTFRQLRGIFQCGNAGGMLRTKEFNTLVIISDHTKGLYDDVWKGKVLHYAGMGQIGDQTLKGNQNRTLYDSRSNGVAVHLFEVFVKGEYVYRGIVQLAGEPYQANQLDLEGTMRKVWIFPVQLLEDKEKEADAEADEKLLDSLAEITDDEIQWDYTYTGGAKEKEHPIIRNGVIVYRRNARTALNALTHARFVCAIDKDHPTFVRKSSRQNYVEPHHLVPLRFSARFDVSLDVEANIVALCSNCHNWLHYGNNYEVLLKQLYDQRKELLENAGIRITFEELKEMYR